jgi:hypothetical protein
MSPDTKRESFHFPSTEFLSAKKNTAEANMAMYPMKKVMATGSELLILSSAVTTGSTAFAAAPEDARSNSKV